MSDDNEFFKNLFAGVKKLEQGRVTPYRKPVSTQAKQRIADSQRELEELLDSRDDTTSYESGDEIKYVRDGHPSRLIKKLRRGDYAIQEELDLHGLIATEAKQETHSFINECARYDIRAIRVIHGKGLNSHHKVPVIKNLLLGWLTNNNHVIAVVSAPENDGGTGAVYVLLA